MKFTYITHDPACYSFHCILLLYFHLSCLPYFNVCTEMQTALTNVHVGENSVAYVVSQKPYSTLICCNCSALFSVVYKVWMMILCLPCKWKVCLTVFEIFSSCSRSFQYHMTCACPTYGIRKFWWTTEITSVQLILVTYQLWVQDHREVCNSMQYVKNFNLLLGFGVTTVLSVGKSKDIKYSTVMWLHSLLFTENFN